MIRNGFFIIGAARRRRHGLDRGNVDRSTVGHLRRGPTRTRPVRLAYPVAPLAVPAGLLPPSGARMAPPRLAPVLGAGLFAAGPGTILVPAVARRADHNLSMAPVAGEQASRLTHPPLESAEHREQGRPGREIA